MKQTRTLSLFFILSFFLNPSFLYAQKLDSLLNNKRVYSSVSIGDLPLPKIDGLLDDTIWTLGEWHGNFTQQQPAGGNLPSEETYIKVLYDHSNLFVAIHCNDMEPNLIRDIFDRRDALSGDMTGIALDSYYDRLTAFEFNLSAAGQKMDLKHLGDYQWDFNWNGVWDGASAKSDSGWVAEMRIPFSQIRYASKEEHVWGMHVWRWIDRRQEEDQWQYIPIDAPAMVYLFGELKGIQNIRESRQVELLPYVLSSVEKLPGGEGLNPFKLNGGLDAKVGISSDYTLDLSINPDFGQVEADPSVLNLTSFETFYEEKRPFFLEGNEIFDFELDGDIPYYSRRIGSAPSFPDNWDAHEISELPNRTTILGAAKLTGKSSQGLSIGLLNGLTAEEYGISKDGTGEEQEIQVAPLSNFLSSRIKKEFNEGNTIAGGMFSLVNRISPDSAIQALLPAAAITGGLDLLHYWDNKNYYMEVKTVASQLQGSRDAILQKQLGHTHRFQRPDADYLELDSTREQIAGHGALIQVGKKGGNIYYNLLAQYRSPGLNLNDMGYIRQADFVGQGGEISYRMNEPGPWVRNYTLTLAQGARWSFGGENIHNRLAAAFALRNNKLWSYSLHYSYDFSHFDIRELRGGPALRNDGEHQFNVSISSNGSKDFSANIGAHLNSYSVNDSHQEILSAELTWLPVRKIRLSALASMNWRKYHQQYVEILSEGDERLYLVGHINQQTPSFTFRGELFLTPELSLQYYASPFFSVGDYSDFKRVDKARERELSARLEELDVSYNEENNSYGFYTNGNSWSFENPDFSFSQFRSNLIFRWEYNLGSTLYLVWAHDRSGWEGAYNPASEIVGDLFGMKGNNVFMFKLNFWFSI
jgi:Domain of unknown function (DUF5916)/Carbohydrate family 9 binding domain-like